MTPHRRAGEGARPNAFQQVFNAAAFGPHVRAGAGRGRYLALQPSRVARGVRKRLSHTLVQAKRPTGAQSPPTARFARK